MGRLMKGVDPVVFWGSSHRSRPSCCGGSSHRTAWAASWAMCWAGSSATSAGASSSSPSAPWPCACSWSSTRGAGSGWARRLAARSSRTFSWISMMFAAGLGAGLLFYGTAEPISHWSAPPHGLAEPRAQEAAGVALRYTYFHWGFNGWALYAIMGGALAYFTFRKGTPMLVSATFPPLLGRARQREAAGPHDRRAGHRRHAVRHCDVAGPERAAAQQRPRVPHRSGQVQRRLSSSSSSSPRCSCSRRRRASSAGSSSLPTSARSRPSCCSSSSCSLGGSTVLVISQGIETIGAYVIQVLPDELADRRRRRGVDGGVDDLLLGVVDLVGAVRGHVRGPDLAGTHDPRVRPRRGGRTDRLRLLVVRRRRRHRDRAAAHRRGRPARSGRHARAVAVHGARRPAAPGRHLGRLRLPDRVVLHQRRGRGLDRDGARWPRAARSSRPSSSWWSRRADGRRSPARCSWSAGSAPCSRPRSSARCRSRS